MRIVLPERSVPRPSYYEIYVKYIVNALRYAGAQVETNGLDYDGRFLFTVNGKQCLMDYSDHHTLTAMWDGKMPYFKFHCHKEHVDKGIHPFTPISFYSWALYQNLAQRIAYTCNSMRIINKQKPYGNATERRNKVRQMLKDRYGEDVNTKPNDPQILFWKCINNCLVAVFVPGCYNFMLDRGHLQYLGFGCCTISPPILDYLPFNRNLVAGRHYVQCKPDYSDLIEKIEWCRENRESCIRIGQSAKWLFEETSTPQNLLRWVKQCLA